MCYFIFRVHGIEHMVPSEGSDFAGGMGTLRTKIELFGGTQPVPKEGLLQTLDEISAVSQSSVIGIFCMFVIGGSSSNSKLAYV